MAHDLRLRPVGLEDESVVLAAQAEMLADRFSFTIGHKPEMSWAAYVEALEDQRRGPEVSALLVPATFLLTCDEENVGSLRTIENCGGTLENIVDNPEGGPRKRRYWIR